MQNCTVCGGTEFFKESGYFYCQSCQTQNEDIREEVLDIRIDTSTRLRRVRVRKQKLERPGEDLGWTSWEQYNLILIGLTEELVQLGVNPDIKLTILQLWASYLEKLEVAFTSTTKKCMPKFSRNFRKRDVEIIYGMAKAKKKRRKGVLVRSTSSHTSASSVSGTGMSEGLSNRDLSRKKKLMVEADYDSFIQSQASSGGDTLSLMNHSLHSIRSNHSGSSRDSQQIEFNKHAMEEAKRVTMNSRKLPKNERVGYQQKHVCTRYRTGAETLTPTKLMALVYVALRLHDEDIHLSDLLRYSREGHISYYKLERLLPPEIVENRTDVQFLVQNQTITHKGMRQAISNFTRFLLVRELECPDLCVLINRYCEELQLPRGIALYAQRLLISSPPKMLPTEKSKFFPNFEGRAIAYVIVVLKTLFALDGITEYEISRIAETINKKNREKGINEPTLFSFGEWQKFIEARKTFLMNLHFPTRMKFEPDSEVFQSQPYLKFLEQTRPQKNMDEQKNEHFPAELARLLHKIVAGLDLDGNKEKKVEDFPASLTPLRSYLARILQDPSYEVPEILQKDFFEAKVRYLTNPETLQELCRKCDLQLKIVDHGLHYHEKIVGKFEQPKLSTTKEMMESVLVEDDVISRRKCHSFMDYIDFKNPGKSRIDSTKKSMYENIQKGESSNLDSNSDEFAFHEILPNGRLNVPNDSDSEDEEEEEGEKNNLSGNKTDNSIAFYKPCHEYWMYHCSFGNLSPRNFELFEKQLPHSFRWLLQECAFLLEMTVDDLYEEVCLLEMYHSLNSKEAKENSSESRVLKHILNTKW